MYFLPFSSILLEKSMINLHQTLENLSIPRNMRGENGKIYTLEFHSELTQETKSFDLVDTGSGGYYIFTLDTSSIAPGEYNYTLYDSAGEIVAKGLAVCNIEESRPGFIQYDITANFKVIQYVPSYELPKYMVISTTATTIPSTDTGVIFKVLSNEDGRITVYKDNEYWTDMPFGSGQTTLAFAFPENTSMEDNVVFRIEGTTDSGKASDSVEITQEKLVFEWKLLPGPQTIPAEQDYISWSVERNTTEPMHLKITLLYEGEYSDRREYEFSSYSIASYFSMGPNSSPYNDLHYTVIAELNGETKSFEVKQEKLVPYLNISSTTPIPASATTMTVEVESNWQGWLWYGNGQEGGSSYFGPQTQSFDFQILENTGSTPVIWTISATTTDFPITKELTVVQENSTDYSHQRFTVEMLEDGDILWEVGGYYYDLNPEVEGYDQKGQVDHGVFGLKAGDIVQFYVLGDNPQGPKEHPLTSTARHNVSGNIMSLIHANPQDTSFPAIWQGQFRQLFKNDTGLVSAENLIIPDTTPTNNCYQEIFQGCTALTKAPQLPATTLSYGCYAWAFFGCTSLTETPVLSAPVLAEISYRQMFKNCTNLNKITCYATNISAYLATEGWTDNVAANGTFTKETNMTDWTTGINGIPSGWTVENKTINR